MNQTEMICEHPFNKQDWNNKRCLVCKKVMRLYLDEKRGTTLEYLNPDVKVFKTKWGDEIKAYPSGGGLMVIEPEDLETYDVCGVEPEYFEDIVKQEEWRQVF